MKNAFPFERIICEYSFIGTYFKYHSSLFFSFFSTSLFKYIFQVILRKFRAQGNGGLKKIVDYDTSCNSLKMGGRSIFSSSVHTNVLQYKPIYSFMPRNRGVPRVFQNVGHHLLGIKSDKAMVKTAKKPFLHTLVNADRIFKLPPSDLSVLLVTISFHSCSFLVS